MKETLGKTAQWLPEEPFTGTLTAKREAVEWAVVWRTDEVAPASESYVNLIPTPLGGTHVNGFRAGLTEALREFCDFRNLLPRGLKLAPEDVWEGVASILSVKMEDPQFSGQTKERLGSRECAGFVSGVVKDLFALWLNQHPESGDEIAQQAIGNAQKRLKAAKTATPRAWAPCKGLPQAAFSAASSRTRRVRGSCSRCWSRNSTGSLPAA